MQGSSEHNSNAHQTLVDVFDAPEVTLFSVSGPLEVVVDGRKQCDRDGIPTGGRDQFAGRQCDSGDLERPAKVANSRVEASFVGMGDG